MESNLKEFAEWASAHAHANSLGAAAAGEGELFTRPVYREPAPTKEPTADPLGLLTLRSFAEYLASGVDLDTDDLSRCLAHVASPVTVQLVSSVQGLYRQRERLVIASFVSPAAIIDRYVAAEDAILGLMATFVDTPERHVVLQMLRELKRENVEVLEDNGASQQVTKRVGVHLAKAATVPSPIELRPFRTFSEVEQPPSLFVVRLREDDGQVKVLIKQADGGLWAVRAAENVGAFLGTMFKSLGLEHPRIIF
jgi:hypothetical protein